MNLRDRDVHGAESGRSSNRPNACGGLLRADLSSEITEPWPVPLSLRSKTIKSYRPVSAGRRVGANSRQWRLVAHRLADRPPPLGLRQELFGFSEPRHRRRAVALWAGVHGPQRRRFGHVDPELRPGQYFASPAERPGLRAMPAMAS